MADTSAGGINFFYPATGGSAGSGTSTSQSQESQQVNPQLANYYQQILGMSNQRYGNMMQAYQNGQNWLQSNLPSVYNQLGAVGNNVQSILGMGQVLGQNGNWGVAAPAAQAIQGTMQGQEAQNEQMAASQGLGNTTVPENLNAGAAGQAEYAYGQLGSQLAGQAAGYASQIGQAIGNLQMQGAGLATGLTQGALGQIGAPAQNTFGALTTSSGSSSSSSRQAQQSQNQGGSGGGQGSGGGNPASGVAGAPGGPSGGGGGGNPYGNSSLVGGGYGTGGGVYGTNGAPGYNPVTAYGTPNNPAQNGGPGGGTITYPSGPNEPADQMPGPSEDPEQPYAPGTDANSNPSNDQMDPAQQIIEQNPGLTGAMQNSGITLEQFKQNLAQGLYPRVGLGPNGPTITSWSTVGGVGYHG